MRTLNTNVLAVLAAALLVVGCGPDGPAPSAIGTQSAELSVPNFRQNDPTWAGDPMGSCADTLAQSGCVVTSMAMLYDYYAPGHTDPRRLNRQMTENGYASGCLWTWGTPYGPPGVRYIGASGVDPSRIDASLAAGHPVLAKTSRFGQHWFLIVGRIDDDYLINDPLRDGTRRLSEAGYPLVTLRLFEGPPPQNLGFACEFSHGNPHLDDGAAPMLQGQQREVELVFRNTGDRPWERVVAGEERANGVVLMSVDRNGGVVPSGAVGDGWFGDPVVTSLSPRGPDRVPPGHAAIFTFNIRVPANTPVGSREYFFMPVQQGSGPQPGRCFGQARLHIDVRDSSCGVCAPGERETKACPRCGHSTRRCGDDCRWGGWGACRGQGACEPDEEKACNNDCGAGRSRCTASCTWAHCRGGTAGECDPGEPDEQACDGERTGACDPGRRRRPCTAACDWGAWGACQGAVEPRRERFDGRDDDCDGEKDELWVPVARCSREGAFRYTDAADGRCPDGWGQDNHGRPYFHLHRPQGDPPLPNTARLLNDCGATDGWRGESLDAAAEYAVYRSEQNRFQVSYPSTWPLRADRETDHVVFLPLGEGGPLLGLHLVATEASDLADWRARQAWIADPTEFVQRETARGRPYLEDTVTGTLRVVDDGRVFVIENGTGAVRNALDPAIPRSLLERVEYEVAR